MCVKHGSRWVMAVYFPNGPQSFTAIRNKLVSDVGAARHREPFGIAFVTNQKLTNSERRDLEAACGDTIAVEIYHLERIVHIIDSPHMAQVREQYLYIYIPAALPTPTIPNEPQLLAIKPDVDLPMSCNPC
jgi:hypothetical protein